MTEVLFKTVMMFQKMSRRLLFNIFKQKQTRQVMKITKKHFKVLHIRYFSSKVKISNFSSFKINSYTINLDNLKVTLTINIFVKYLQFKIVNNNMQKSFYPRTPQKPHLNKSTKHNQHLLKGLSPHLLTVGSSGYGKPKLQMMHSPVPINQDLFSELIQTQRKLNYDEYYNNYQILEEDYSFQILDDFDVQECTQQQDSLMIDENDEEQDENGIKKRKRKSTAQIKILKHQLQIEQNWSKQKIAEMSEITGLSQSQVYKWWWDQKKKNAKYQKDNNTKMLAKKKFIKKDLSKRAFKNETDQNSQDEIEQQIMTKPKNTIEIYQVPQTERKVNKRLAFV